jgi:prephenate dehydratase
MRNIRVAIFGSATSFHELAAQQFYGEDIRITECSSFRMCCDKLIDNSVDYAVMAIENSTAGSILPNYTLIEEFGLHIIGERYLQVQLHLLAQQGVKLSEIECIQSHPMALAQCSVFLSKHPNIRVIEHTDTASAVREIREKNLKTTAAIGNELSSLIYNVPVLKSSIHNVRKNYTRFLLLSKGIGKPAQPDKASVCFRLKHETGNLCDVLTVFKKNRVSLSKIQSVPVPGKPNEYSFHTDLEWSDYELYRKAIKTLRKNTSSLSVLGEYMKSSLN